MRLEMSVLDRKQVRRKCASARMLRSERRKL